MMENEALGRSIVSLTHELTELQKTTEASKDLQVIVKLLSLLYVFYNISKSSFCSGEKEVT